MGNLRILPCLTTVTSMDLHFGSGNGSPKAMNVVLVLVVGVVVIRFSIP